MVEKIVGEIAEQKGLRLSEVILVDGQRLGCADANLLKVKADGHLVCALIYQSDLDQLVLGFKGDVENRVHAALSKLHVLVKSGKTA